MLFYLTSALSRPLISLSPTTPGTITSLPTPIPLMSALLKVLFGPCTRSSVEVPFTAHKLAQVVIFTLPPCLRRFLETRGRSVLRLTPPPIRYRRSSASLASAHRWRGNLRLPPKVWHRWSCTGAKHRKILRSTRKEKRRMHRSLR